MASSERFVDAAGCSVIDERLSRRYVRGGRYGGEDVIGWLVKARDAGSGSSKEATAVNNWRHSSSIESAIGSGGMRNDMEREREAPELTLTLAGMEGSTLVTQPCPYKDRKRFSDSVYIEFNGSSCRGQSRR